MRLRIIRFHADMRFMRFGYLYKRLHFPNTHDFYVVSCGYAFSYLIKRPHNRIYLFFLHKPRFSMQFHSDMRLSFRVDTLQLNNQVS